MISPLTPELIVPGLLTPLVLHAVQVLLAVVQIVLEGAVTVVAEVPPAHSEEVALSYYECYTLHTPYTVHHYYLQRRQHSYSPQIGGAAS